MREHAAQGRGDRGGAARDAALRSPQGGANKTTKDSDAHGKNSPGGGRNRRDRHGRRTGRRERAAAASLNQLTSDVCTRIQECALQPADQSRIDNCVGQLQAAARTLGEGWVVKLFGSVANGFCTRASDIDAAFVRESVAGEPPQEPPAAANLMKEELIPILREQQQFEITEEILGAKVPILKLRFDGELDVDLSCQNNLPFQNTQLLKAYSSLDAHVRDLGIAVKLWAKAAGVCGACQGNLSSYTFTLLTIYFMQVHQDVKLPCLPPAAFAEGGGEAGQAKLAAARSVWSNRLSLGDLLFRFFMFYTHDFVWGYEVVSVRLGHRLHTHEQFFEELRGKWQARLHVEDPYQLERNLHCVLGEVEEGQLREAFSQAAYYIQCGRSPVGLGPDGEDPAAAILELDAAAEEPAEGPAEAVHEFQGFATSPPPTPQASQGSPPASPQKETVKLAALCGAAGESLSSASTRGSLSDGALESSGDERHQVELEMQWWKCMGAVDVEDAVQRSGDPRVAADKASISVQAGGSISTWVTVQDLEGRIVATKPSSLRVGANDMKVLIGTGYSAKATGSIARRVAKACQKHVSWQ